LPRRAAEDTWYRHSRSYNPGQGTEFIKQVFGELEDPTVCIRGLSPINLQLRYTCGPKPKIDFSEFLEAPNE